MKNGRGPTWDFWISYLVGTIFMMIIFELLKAKGIL